jgi:hypothetical protein
MLSQFRRIHTPVRLLRRDLQTNTEAFLRTQAWGSAPGRIAVDSSRLRAHDRPRKLAQLPQAVRPRRSGAPIERCVGSDPALARLGARFAGRAAFVTKSDWV